MSKRKLPKVGIFDPNLSQDPQYGNVSTLPDNFKRVHFHTEFQPTAQDTYYRHQIVLPECGVPKINSKELDKVTKITVPIIKNFQVQMIEGGKLDKVSNAAAYIGLFETDALNLGPFQDLDGSPGTEKLEEQFNQEAIFILNKPISYFAFENDDEASVSNCAARGYICLQNYVNIFVALKNCKLNEQLSFSAYIDYVHCETTYQDALVWKADFEKFIEHRLKYRVHFDDEKNVTIISRGDLATLNETDPSTFPHVVKNTDTHFKVSKREVELAAMPTKEAVWAQAMKKYYSDS